jgi:hypothetical protein
MSPRARASHGGDVVKRKMIETKLINSGWKKEKQGQLILEGNVWEANSPVDLVRKELGPGAV